MKKYMLILVFAIALNAQNSKMQIFKPITMKFTKSLKFHLPIMMNFQNFIIHLDPKSMINLGS